MTTYFDIFIHTWFCINVPTYGIKNPTTVVYVYTTSIDDASSGLLINEPHIAANTE